MLKATSDSRAASFLAALPWLVPALLILLVKRELLAAGGAVGAREAAGFWQELSFYRMDLLLAGVAIPLSVFSLFAVLSAAWRTRLSVLLNLFTGLAVYIQYRALLVSGTFISFDTAWVAFTWGLREPAANLQFVSSSSVMYAGGTAIGLVSAAYFATRRKQMLAGSSRVRHLLARCTIVSFGALAAFALLSWSFPARATVSYRSAAVLMARAYFSATAAGDSSNEQLQKEYSALTFPALLESYRSLTHSPSPADRTPQWAAARGANVIFFILETTPTRFLDFAGNLDAYPNFRRLRDRSFVASQHYTTGLLTDLALYSVFSSSYPSPDGTIPTGRDAHLRIPSLFSQVGEAGYKTAVYSPFHWRAASDEAMFSRLGVQSHIFSDTAILWGAEMGSGDWRESRIAHDRAALSLLRKDMAVWLNDRTPFLAVFAPQVGHVPLPLLENNGAPQTEQQVIALERQVLKMQDGWLGEILLLLEQHQRLERTIIVILGDHGIRVKNEDPAFTPGIVSDLSFRVPLLIYVPQVLQETRVIPWVTSHIDITPSILDLLGISSPESPAQGAPLWSPSLARRTIFLFARRSMAADGYHDESRFYMTNYLSDLAYVGPKLDFDATDPIDQYSAEQQHINESIARMGALQEAIEERLGQTYRDPAPLQQSTGSRP